MRKLIKYPSILLVCGLSVILLHVVFSPKAKSLDEKALPEEARKEGLYPSNLLKLDSRFSHHVILVEKATHKIYLYENENTYPKFIKSFTMASGKNRGDKMGQGDLKTPEGIYQLTSFKSGQTLSKQYGKEGEIYGIGAFVLNYPNIYDHLVGKTGDGIWFHGTNDESRISKGLDSRGCVVTINDNVKEISQYIELENTNIIIVENLNFLSENTWTKNGQDIEKTVTNWWKAWSEKNLKSYMSFYDSRDFKDRVRGNFSEFKNYKKAVFAIPDTPQIKLTNFSIFNSDKYAVVQFEQEYHSIKINDTGRKTLYLKRDHNYEWKIFAEIWSRLPRSQQLSSFTPKQRYFN